MNVKKLPVFRNLSDEELEKSLHCARSILVNFQKDEYIYRQEDEPKRLYFVLEGKVELGEQYRQESGKEWIGKAGIRTYHPITTKQGRTGSILKYDQTFPFQNPDADAGRGTYSFSCKKSDSNR